MTAAYNHYLETIFAILMFGNIGTLMLGQRLHEFTYLIWVFYRLYNIA